MVPRSRYSVGPATSTKTNSSTAATMLRFDRRLMPLSSPRATDTHAMSDTMMMSSTWTLTDSSKPYRRFRPALICIVPRPMDTATPKTVPTTATTSTIRPIGP